MRVPIEINRQGPSIDAISFGYYLRTEKNYNKAYTAYRGNSALFKSCLKVPLYVLDMEKSILYGMLLCELGWRPGSLQPEISLGRRINFLRNKVDIGTGRDRK